MTRRVFATCALCAAGGFWAGAVEAQTTQTPGLTRTLLKQSDGPVAGYVTVALTSRMLKDQSDAVRAAAAADLRAWSAGRAVGDRVPLPGAIWIVTARKPPR